jgi:WD40 repeat protein
MIKAMRAVASKKPSLMVYRLCRQFLRASRAEDNLSYLQMIAYQSGESTLARAVDTEPIQRQWSVRWAHRTYEASHHVLGRHGEEGSSTLGRICRIWNGAHSVDVADLDGRNTAITCGYDGQIRMWDLDETLPFGEPFIFTGDLWALPMFVSICRHGGQTFLIVLTGIGNVFAWVWRGSFVQLGKLATVLSVDLVDHMAVSSTKERSLIAGCGTVTLEHYRWDAAGCSRQSLKGLIAPAAAAFAMAGDEDVIAVGNIRAMAVFRLNGDVLWRKETAWSDRDFDHERVTSVGASPSVPGIAIFGTGHGNISVHDVNTGDLVSNPIKAHCGAVTCLTVVNLGNASILLSGGGDSVIRLWNLPDLTPIGGALRGHNAGINALKVWPIGGAPFIISASADATIRVWDFPAVGAAATSRAPERVIAVALGEIDASEAVIALTASGDVQFWASESGDTIDSYAFALDFDRKIPPVNRIASGFLSADRWVAIASTMDEVKLWNPVTGEVTTSSNPSEPPVTNQWCACLGAVRGRLARVAFHEHDQQGFVEVFDLGTGQSLSVSIEAEGPVNSLRLGEIRGEPVIVGWGRHGLLFVARLSDGSIVGSPFTGAAVAGGAGFTNLACSVDVGELHDKPVVVAAVLGGETVVTIISLSSNAPRISIDVGAEVHGLAIAPSGILVGTTKGLLKLDVSRDAL